MHLIALTAIAPSTQPTIWILEGVAYYIPLDEFKQLIWVIHSVSSETTQLFLDVCVPAISEIQVGPFTPHFKWGLEFDEAHDFFTLLGWDTSVSYADDYDHGRDVGQKGLIFVHGWKQEFSSTIMSKTKSSAQDVER